MDLPPAFPCGRKARYRGLCARFRGANALLGWEQSGLEPSWAQYTMDPADRIDENAEALAGIMHSPGLRGNDLLILLYLRFLASHFIINAIIKYGFPNQR